MRKGYAINLKIAIVQEPCSILLGLEKQWIGSGAKRTYTEVREEMMYIPILETIPTLLNNPEVHKQHNACLNCS